VIWKRGRSGGAPSGAQPWRKHLLFCWAILSFGGHAGLQCQYVVADYEVLLDLGILRKFQARLYISGDRARFDWGSPEMPLESRDSRELRVQVAPPDTIGTYNYTDSRGALMYSTVASLEGATRILKEPLPAIHWKITEKQREIGAYRCLYAEGFFRGRKYGVWFTPDIPVHFGPWKLYGLPGLVVSASDENHAVTFRLHGLTPGDSFPETDFSDLEPIDLAAYRNFLKDRSNRLLRRIQARMPRGAQFRLTDQQHLEIFQ